MVNIPQDGMSLTVQMEVRCRACLNCLKSRAAHWRLRALAEYRAGEAAGCRTWMSTLTITPARRQLILAELRRNLDWQGVDFDELSEHERFQSKHAQISKEITRYVKRVRKNSGCVLRMLCVAERHEGGGQLNGEPHYHMLWHETERHKPLRQKVLNEAWTWGFSHHKLVADPRQAAYVCKYLSKSAMARVRASLEYGMSAESARPPAHIVTKERDKPDPQE